MPRVRKCLHLQAQDPQSLKHKKPCAEIRLDWRPQCAELRSAPPLSHDLTPPSQMCFRS